MKIFFLSLIISLHQIVFADTFHCSDYKDQNLSYTNLKLEVLENEMIVSFPKDIDGRHTEKYTRVVDQGFKVSGFAQKTDIISGAIWTFGVDIYKETFKVHRYIVSGPGFNLVYGEANECELAL